MRQQPDISTTAAAPRPLLPLALCFAAGIAVSEQTGAVLQAGLTAAVSGVLVAAATAALFCVTRRQLQQLAGGRLLRLASTLLCAAALCAGVARHQLVARLPPEHIAHALERDRILVRVAGVVLSAPQSEPAERHNPFVRMAAEPRTRFILRLAELRSGAAVQPLAGDIRVNVTAVDLPVQLGDFVELTGWLAPIRGRQNLGETDWRTLLRYQGIHATLTVPEPQFVRVEQAPHTALERIRTLLRTRIAGALLGPAAHADWDEAARAVEAMVLGQRSAVSRSVDEAFLRTGTVHILSVSGSHIGVIAGAVWLLMRWLLRRGRSATALLTIIAIWTYYLLAEPSGPIFRAALMGTFACGAVLLGRPVTSVNWLAASALALLIAQPLELFRAGFQFSFLQVLALFMVVPPLYTRLVRGDWDEEQRRDADSPQRLALRWAGRATAGLLVASLVAWLAAAPLTLWHFGFVTPWGALQSLLLTPLFALVIAAGFAAALASALVPSLGPAAGAIVTAGMGLLLKTVRALANWRHSYLELAYPPTWLVAASYALLILVFLLWLEQHQRTLAARTEARRRRTEPPRARFGTARGAAMAGSALLLGLLWLGRAPLHAPPADTYDLHVLSVGSGSAAFLAAPDGAAVIFDCGTLHDFDAGQTLRRVMRETGAGPAVLTISHDNYDHYSGAPTLLTGGEAAEVLVSPFFLDKASYSKPLQRLVEACGGRGRFRTILADEVLSVGRAQCDLLWPPADLPTGWSENDQSLVFRVSVHRQRILIPGDIEDQAMAALLSAARAGDVDLQAEVLIAPHHGSMVRRTGEFLQAVNPRVLIVSTGREREQYSALVREVLGAEVQILSTREVGGVRVFIGRRGIEVRTPGRAAHGSRDGPH